MIIVTAPLQIWTGEEGSSHFLRLPADAAGEIHEHARALRRAFGSVRVEATIGDVVWRTSAFPVKGGGYFLPMKAEVCRKSKIAVGEDVTVALQLL